MPLSSKTLMTGFTSSSNNTRSPITIASATPAFPGENAAHVVSPMKGGIFQPSTATSTSLRGNATRTAPSAVFSVDSACVADLTAASSIDGESAGAAGDVEGVTFAAGDAAG